MTLRRDLLEAPLDDDGRNRQTLAGRIAHWLSTDIRTLGRLRLELQRCRLTHEHEVARLRTLIERGDALARPRPSDDRMGPDAEPEIV